ncbi:MAG: arginine repressor [Acidobacteria bacterium]|nr:arginine repressor [Acidobacteriota bacterium]
MRTKTEGWRRRRAAIEEILRREDIHSQADLVAQLTARGFPVTQSSVSRDLQRIGATRVNGRYVSFDTLRVGQVRASDLKDVAGFILSVDAAGSHLLVVKTPPGIASMVALSLDHADWPEVVGTVAGDDTFFIAAKGRRQQARVRARLEQVTRGEGDA